MRKVFTRVATAVAVATTLSGCVDNLEIYANDYNSGISASETAGNCRISGSINTSGYRGLGLRC